MIKRLGLFIILIPSCAYAAPKFGNAGGIGAANSTYSDGEPTGGAYSINGISGAISAGPAAFSGPVNASSLNAPLQMTNVAGYGAKGDGTSDDGPAVRNAITAAGKGGITFFPYKSGTAGYNLTTGSFTLGGQEGAQFFNGNRFQGSAAGDPSTGNGKLTSPQTQPFVQTTHYAFNMDPSRIWQAPGVTNSGFSVNCSPSTPNPNPADIYSWTYTANDGTHTVTGPQNYVLCVYKGMDTSFTGDALVYLDPNGNPQIVSKTNMGTELENEVLNVDNASGIGHELDVNNNVAPKLFVRPDNGNPWECDIPGTATTAQECLGYQPDGREVKGITVYGGGSAPVSNITSFNGVAFDVDHGTYSGGRLDWHTGLRIRHARTGVDVQRSAATDIYGDFLIGRDQNGAVETRLSKNGSFYTLLTPSNGVGYSINGGANADLNLYENAATGRSVYHHIQVNGAARMIYGASAAQAAFISDEAHATNIISNDNAGTTTIGAAGLGIIIAGRPILPKMTVAQLGSCGGWPVGTMVIATDLTAVSYNAVATGGGTNAAPVVCLGSNWYIH